MAECRVAVAAAKYAARRNPRLDYIGGHRHESSFRVYHRHVHNAERAVGGFLHSNVEAGGLSCRSHALPGGNTPLAVAHGFHIAGTIYGLPRQIAVGRHRFTAKRAAIDTQIHLVEIRVHPHIDFLALVALKIPVREYMERGLVGPPRAQIVSLVFGEAAIVQDAELRAGGREVERCRLAAIVETGPVEQSCQPRTLLVELPAALYAVESSVGIRTAVVSRHTAFAVSRVIHTACSAA